jgi:hypothetical protein
MMNPNSHQDRTEDGSKIAGASINQPKRNFCSIRGVSLWFLLTSGTGCLALALVFGNCGIIMAPALPVVAAAAMATDGISQSVEYAKGPIPETQWNHDGLWRRVSDNPPT